MNLRGKTKAVFVPLLLIVSGAFSAIGMGAEPPPPPMIAETWSCNYNSGKDMEDVLKARDYMLREAEKAGISLPDSYIWTLAKGNIPVETVWFNIHEHLGAYAATSDAWVASGISEAVLDRFYNASTCTTGLGTMRPVFGREGLPEDDSPTFIAASGCRFKKGAGGSHLADLMSHARDVQAGMGDSAPYFSAMLEPFTARPPGSADVFIFSVYNNATEWGNYVNTLYATQAGQMLINHRDMILDCDTTLWTGQWVVQAGAGE